MSIWLIILMIQFAGWLVALRPVGKKYLDSGPPRVERFVESDCPTFYYESKCRAAHGMTHIRVSGGPHERNAKSLWIISGKAFLWPALALGEFIKLLIPLSEAEKQAKRDLAEAKAREAEERNAKELEALEKERVALEADLFKLQNGHSIEDEIEKRAAEKADARVKELNDKFRNEAIRVKEALWKDHLKNLPEPSIDVERVELGKEFPKAPTAP